MKKLLYSIAMVAIGTLGALSVVSCKSDSIANPYDKEPAVKVLASDVLFDANAASGVIEVAAKGAVTAESKSQWCTLDVSGNTITASVAENPSLEGRSADIVIRCQQDSTVVYAQQKGIHYTFSDTELVFEMAGGRQQILGESSFPVTVEKDADWITVTPIEGGFDVAVSMNEEDDIRRGHVYVKLGDIVSTYTIIQKFERNLSGEYSIFFYTNASKSASRTYDVTLTRSSTDFKAYTLAGIPNATPIALTYDDVNNRLVAANGQYLGQYSTTEWLYLCVYYTDLAETSNYYNVSVGNSNYYVYFNVEKNQDGKYVFTIYDSAPLFNTERRSQGFYVYTFTTPPTEALATANRKTTIWMVRNPVLTQK